MTQHQSRAHPVLTSKRGRYYTHTRIRIRSRGRPHRQPACHLTSGQTANPNRLADQRAPLAAAACTAKPRAVHSVTVHGPSVRPAACGRRRDRTAPGPSRCASPAPTRDEVAPHRTYRTGRMTARQGCSTAVPRTLPVPAGPLSSLCACARRRPRGQGPPLSSAATANGPGRVLGRRRG